MMALIKPLPRTLYTNIGTPSLFAFSFRNDVRVLFFAAMELKYPDNRKNKPIKNV
tara:strand:+ start:3757 stop:3921 length:165 start_codon:yes stop_codon:yes gene_type:complete